MYLQSHLCRAEAIIAAGGPHRIPSPFNPHSGAPSQGLSSSALSKKHLSSSVSQLERTDHSLPYSLPYLSRLRFQKTIPFALPLNNNYLKQRIEELILQPAKGGGNTLQLCAMLAAETERKTFSRKQEKHPDGNSTAFPAVAGSNLSSAAHGFAPPVHSLLEPSSSLKFLKLQ